MKGKLALAALVMVAGAVGIGLWAYHASISRGAQETRYSRVLRGMDALIHPSDGRSWDVSNRELNRDDLRRAYTAGDPAIIAEVIKGADHVQVLSASRGTAQGSVWYAVLDRPDLASKLIGLEYKAVRVHADEVGVNGGRVVDYPVSSPLKGIKGDFANKLSYTIEADGVPSVFSYLYVSRGNAVVGMTFRGMKIPRSAPARVVNEVFDRLHKAGLDRPAAKRRAVETHSARA